jgi:hypothetical protein
MLWDVVLFVVVDEDWTLFSPGNFPCCFYNLVVLCNVSRSPASGEGVLLTCFKPNNYSTTEPLSCFFVTSGLLQDVEISITNIYLQRRILK